MRILNNHRGFSLVELLIGIAILAIIMAAVFGVLSASVTSQQYNFDEGANIQDARVTLNEVSNQLRNATSLSNTLAHSLTYRVLNDTSDRTIALGSGTDAGYVLITDSAGVTKKYGSGRIVSLDFTYASVGETAPYKRKISIQVQVKNPARSGAPLSDLTTSVVTLNSF